ncbi:hypothetical protein HY932_01545 [Candidatus Falkowbacteria bacterium]|nr:hypothetical protein [Candidatus Falkowbacteria bacterium]
MNELLLTFNDGFATLKPSFLFVNMQEGEHGDEAAEGVLLRMPPACGAAGSGQGSSG